MSGLFHPLHHLFTVAARSFPYCHLPSFFKLVIYVNPFHEHKMGVFFFFFLKFFVQYQLSCMMVYETNVEFDSRSIWNGGWLCHWVSSPQEVLWNVAYVQAVSTHPPTCMHAHEMDNISIVYMRWWIIN